MGSSSSHGEAGWVGCSSLSLSSVVLQQVSPPPWHVLIIALRWALVCPADTALAVASEGGALHCMPRGMQAVHAVAVPIPLRARLVTQFHGFLCATLTPLLPKVVHPLQRDHAAQCCLTLMWRPSLLVIGHWQTPTWGSTWPC